jgi:hypothetical protein
LGLHEDEKSLICNQTVPTFRIFCARISPSRWDCHSVTQNARVAAAARRLDALNGGTFKTRNLRSRRRYKKSPPLPSVFGFSASQLRRRYQSSPETARGLVAGFGYYVATTVANGVQSGNGRTQANDNKTDYYPVALKEETLRPGTIYADPYGHVLLLARTRATVGLTRRACCLPSMRNPTVPSRGSAFGAAISYSRRILPR